MDAYVVLAASAAVPTVVTETRERLPFEWPLKPSTKRTRSEWGFRFLDETPTHVVLASSTAVAGLRMARVRVPWEAPL